MTACGRIMQEEQAEYDRLREDYAGFGGIPLPSPSQAFPSIEEITRTQTRNETDFEAVQDAGRSEQAASSEDNTQEEAVPGTETGQMPGEVAGETGLSAEDQIETVSAEGNVAEDFPGINFHITDDHLGEGGPKEKFARNIEAIQTLFTLEAENRKRKTVMPHWKSRKSFPSMSAGAALRMPLIPIRTTGQKSMHS